MLVQCPASALLPFEEPLIDKAFDACFYMSTFTPTLVLAHAARLPVLYRPTVASFARLRFFFNYGASALYRRLAAGQEGRHSTSQDLQRVE